MKSCSYKIAADDADLTKSPKIRRFLALIYLFLTANKPSPHDESG